MLESLMARLGEMWTVTLAGAAIGLPFGFFAHRSRFCLRSAVVEFWNRDGSGKLAVRILFWLGSGVVFMITAWQWVSDHITFAARP